MKRLLLFMMALPVLGGCTSEEDASKVVLFVKQSARSVTGGEKLYFDIEARTIDNYIDRFEIASFDAASGRQVLLTEQPRTSLYTLQYVYTAPVAAVDSLSVELTFTATDDCGCVQRQSCRVGVRNNAEPLVERSGYTLYAAHSGGFDAFSFAGLRTLKRAEADPADVDLYAGESPAGQEAVLSRIWRSETGVKFAKVNAFDYAGATRSAVASLYANSRCDDFVEGLAIDDVILLGRGDRALGVVKIVAVYDEAGASEDRYLFNLKPMDND